MFADVTKILLTETKRTGSIRNANSTLTEISMWFQDNKLVLNITKTTILDFTLSDSTIHDITNEIIFFGLQIDINSLSVHI